LWWLKDKPTEEQRNKVTEGPNDKKLERKTVTCAFKAKEKKDRRTDKRMME
jgi:hypothetical protein